MIIFVTIIMNKFISSDYNRFMYIYIYMKKQHYFQNNNFYLSIFLSIYLVSIVYPMNVLWCRILMIIVDLYYIVYFIMMTSSKLIITLIFWWRKSTRLETRIAGADANPYLSIAASIAAGLYGIRHKLFVFCFFDRVDYYILLLFIYF